MSLEITNSARKGHRRDRSPTTGSMVGAVWSQGPSMCCGDRAFTGVAVGPGTSAGWYRRAWRLCAIGRGANPPKDMPESTSYRRWSGTMGAGPRPRRCRLSASTGFAKVAVRSALGVRHSGSDSDTWSTSMCPVAHDCRITERILATLTRLRAAGIPAAVTAMAGWGWRRRTSAGTRATGTLIAVEGDGRA